MQCLLNASEFLSEAFNCCLKPLLTATFDASRSAELVAAYAHALSLRYDQGAQVILAIMRKHRKMIPMKQLPQLLQAVGHADLLMDLVQEIVHDDNTQELLQKISVAATKPSAGTKSVAEALAAIYESQAGCDFSIVIGSPSASTKPVTIMCHAFVVASRWPYFSHVISADMREAHSSKLTLPAPGEDGGMHPVAVRAILDFVYLGKLRESTKKEFGPIVAMTLLACSDLYFSSVADTSKDEATARYFDPLIAFAKHQVDHGLTYENCISTYTMAMQLGVEDVAKKAMKMIAMNLKRMYKDPAQQEQLKSLSQDVPDMWQCYLEAFVSL